MDYFLSGLSYCGVRIDPRDGLRHMTDDHVVEIRSFIHGRNSGKTTKKDHDTQRYRTDVLNGIIAESGQNVLRVCRDIQRVMYKCDAPVSL